MRFVHRYEGSGEGGACVWGKLMPAAESLRVGGLPIGLANRVPLIRDIPAGAPVTVKGRRAEGLGAPYWGIE